MTKEEEMKAGLWQQHRVLCLELALKGGASCEDMIEAAEKIGEYILKKSKLEKIDEASGLQAER